VVCGLVSERVGSCLRSIDSCRVAVFVWLLLMLFGCSSIITFQNATYVLLGFILERFREVTSLSVEVRSSRWRFFK
jgi:hypothetical protein